MPSDALPKEARLPAVLRCASRSLRRHRQRRPLALTRGGSPQHPPRKQECSSLGPRVTNGRSTIPHHIRHQGGGRSRARRPKNATP